MLAFALFELFALGTIGFWVFIGIFTIFLIASLENETNWFMGVLFAAAALLIGPSILAHFGWVTLGIGLIVYVIGGAIWSWAKWQKHVTRVVERARDGDTVYDREIDVKVNKARITAWIAAWPWSLFWTLTHDIFNSIYEAMLNRYRKISAKGAADLAQIRAESAQRPK